MPRICQQMSAWSLPYLFVGAANIVMLRSGDNLAQERTLLDEDEFVLLGIAEIRHAFLVGANPRPIAFIFRQAWEFQQAERDVVGALMRHPVAEAFAAAIRDDGEPAPRVFLEHRALERVELVADENGDSHENLHGACLEVLRIPACSSSMLRLLSKSESRTR